MPMLSIQPLDQLQAPVANAVLVSRQGPRRNAWHHGIDLSVLNARGQSARGATIRPIAPGVVEQVCRYPENCCGGYGSYVLVKHADDLFSFYAHMDRVDVEAGQSVDWGSSLGVVGDQFANFRQEGCPRLSMVPHLHLEIRHADGTRYDVLHVLAAGGLKVGTRGVLERVAPFDYEEPRLAGMTEKSGEPFPYRETIVGSPALRYGRWYTVGLPVGISVGMLALGAGIVWFAEQVKR